ncbi:MAG TPA: hypothetical protein VKV73_03620, partial [Chloroflexota bacterium]|nr:hypothetical protein [Chloroflexota bacterium]
MAAYLESGARKSRFSRGRDANLVSLAEAARRLGFHVETLRLRVRRGELPARRGAHGAYFISQGALARIKPPRRSRRRSFVASDLEWSWLALGQEADNQGASYPQLRAIGLIRRRPTLAKGLARLFDVQRLSLAGLTSAEIADLTGLSKRHVRRLSHTDLKAALERGKATSSVKTWLPAQEDEELEDDEGIGIVAMLDKRRRRRRDRAARRNVAKIQRQLEAAGLRYHQRSRRPDDLFVARVPLRAFKAKKLDQAVVAHLFDAGLSSAQI